jgi:hypothetical protein
MNSLSIGDSSHAVTRRSGTRPAVQAPKLLHAMLGVIFLATALPVRGNDAPQQLWVGEASEGLDARVLYTVRRLDGVDRQLLALRAYLRAGTSLMERWSWSEQRLSAYPSTPEGKAAARDIDAVANAFASANPGYTLQVNRQPRSLDLQIAHWNENPSVAANAAALSQWLRNRFASRSEQPTAEELRRALMELAAAGCDNAGRPRAVCARARARVRFSDCACRSDRSRGERAVGAAAMGCRRLDRSASNGG